jgi:hypothetical protein
MNLNLPLLSDGKTNPIPTEFEITHAALPVGIDLTMLTRCNDLSTLQHQKQHGQSNHPTQLREGKLISQSGSLQVEAIGLDVQKRFLHTEPQAILGKGL